MRNNIFRLMIIGMVFAITNCGVRGDPIPPKADAKIGSGKPDFKKVDPRYRVGKKKNGDQKSDDEKGSEE